jgi:hypothetical protein
LETDVLVPVFEDKEFADQAVLAVEKEIHHDAFDPTKQAVVVHSEDIASRQSPTNRV